MRSTKATRWLSGTLAALMLAQGMCLPAGAWSLSSLFGGGTSQMTTLSETQTVELKDGTAVIPEDATPEQVKEILFEALVVNQDDVEDPQSLNWEYYCKGKLTPGLTWGNRSWGSVNGFISEEKGMFDITLATYTHPALKDNDDDTYSVRLEGGSQEVTLTKTAKLDSSITLKEGPYVVGMVYNDDQSYNYTATAAAIYDAVVASTVPGLTAENVKVQYDASLTGLGNYKDLNNSDLANLKKFGLGEWKIKISWDGNDDYYGFAKEVTVNITERTSGEIVLNANQEVALPFIDATTVNYEELETAIFDAVVNTTTPEMAVKDVTIEYYATANTGSVGSVGEAWMPLEGGTSWGLTYPGMTVGENQQIRISWDGNSNYTEVFAETTVNIVDSRKPTTITLKENCKVGLYDGNDWDAVRQEILTNVVAANNYDLTTDNTTIEYYNPGLTIGDMSLGAEWVPLEGKNRYPAVQDNQTYKVRVTFNGSADYKQATSNEVEVRFASKQDSSVSVNSGDYSAKLSYNEDLSVNYDALREDIYEAVVASTDPADLTWNSADMTITYLATYKLFDTNSDTAANDILTEWVPLEGEEETVGYYPAISEGKQQIKITWGGNDDYYGFETEATVNITGREQAPYELNNPIGAVTLAVDESLNVNYAELYKAIFDAVVADSEVLTAGNVTIEYLAALKTGSVSDLDKAWAPLEGTTLRKAISAGEQKIRISWPGSQQYAPTTIEATVQVNDREQVQFNLNGDGENYEVGMVFNAEQGYDYAATAKAIYNAVVASTTPAVDFSQVTLEFSKTGANFEPLDQTNFFTSFGVGKWKIKISVADAQTYRGDSVTVNVTTTDNRIASAVVLKEGVSFTYNMDANVMKQAIFDNVIDWTNSTLPAKETLSLDDFVIEYQAKLTDAESGVDLGLEDLKDLFGGIFGDKLDDIVLTQWVPLEGKVYSIGNTVLGQFPQIGAGENQSIRISYKGNADYRPSETTDGTVTVNKAKVSVKVNSTNIYADEALPAGFITTDPADEFDIYTIYAGITSSVSTGVYLDLPERYTAEGSLLLQLIDKALETAGQKTLTQMMNDGVTVGELRELFSTQELLDLLDKLNIDTGTFGQILTVINKLPGIMDSVRIGFGTPNRAGLYTVTAITDNKNYETGVGFGFLLTKMRFSGPKLTWNQEISGGKLTAEQAKTFDFGATLSYNGDVTVSQEGVHYLYSGFTSKWRIYSSTTTPPTEPGRYVVTVCILGGNYMAAPITRSFQITN